MPKPGWVRDQAAHDDHPPLTPEEKGEVLVQVIALGEAIVEAKGGRVDPGPLLMPTLTSRRRRHD